MTFSSPTLLVFTLGAANERRRRPLVGAKAARLETELRHACLERLLAAGQETGCRTVVASPRPIEGSPEVQDQGAGSFGSRLRRSMASIGASDRAPLVVVGTDIPDLGGRQIEQAIESLRKAPNKVVIGPSPDGGLYLLATCLDLDEILNEVSWQCRNTLTCLKAALLRRNIEVVELESLADLDGPQDLERWLFAHPPILFFRSLRKRLKAILREACRPLCIDSPDLFHPIWIETRAGRAPPF